MSEIPSILVFPDRQGMFTLTQLPGLAKCHDEAEVEDKKRGYREFAELERLENPQP